MQRLTNFVIRARWPIIVGFIAITIASASRLPTVEIDPEVKNMLPRDMPARINLDAIEELFGGTSMIMVVVSAPPPAEPTAEARADILAPDTLRRVRKLSRKIERIKGVDRVLSLFTTKDIRAESGDMVVESAVLHIPENDAEREELRARLEDNDMIYGNVVSEGFDATVIIGLLNAEAKDEDILPGIDAALEEIPGPEEVQVAGMPFVRTHIGRDIRRDMSRFLPLSLGIMLIFLLIAFRQIRGVALPFLVVVMSIVFAFGLIPVLGWKIQIVTIMLPLILVAVANDYGIHLFARYQEENTADNRADAKTIAKSIITHLAAPVIITGVTTVGGMLCLLSHVIVPAKQVGVLAAAGVTYALIGSLLFIPAILSLMPKAKPIKQAASSIEDVPLLEKLLRANARLVVRKPKAVIVGVLVVVGIAAIGTIRVRVDTNPINYYDEDAPVARSATLVNDKFGGSTALSMVIEGDVKDPGVLAELDHLQQKLEEMEDVGQTSSVATMVKTMNRAMNDDDPKEERLPDSREAIAQYFLMYQLSGDPEDFDRLVDFPFEHALLTARIKSSSTSSIARVVDEVAAYIADRPGSHFTLVGGFAAVFSEMIGAIVFGQVVSLILSLLVVALLVSLLFRSFVSGALASVPLILSMGVLFGLLGIFDMELNVPIAMLSSMMIGIGVDYTIHFFWRYRDERRAGLEPPEAARVTLITSGRGIVFNALSVIIGFLATFASSFLPVRSIGLLVIVCIGSCLIGAMVLLPAVALVFKPKFLEPSS